MRSFHTYIMPFLYYFQIRAFKGMFDLGLRKTDLGFQNLNSIVLWKLEF